MKRNIVTLVCATAVLSSASGQDPIPNWGDPWLMGEGAIAVPSLQGLGFGKGSVTLPNIQAWAANTAMPFRPLRDALVRNRYSDKEISNIANSTDDRFFLTAGLQLQLLSLGFNLGGKDGGLGVSIGVEHRERTLFVLDIDRELVTLLYNGNKQYAGRELLLDPLDIRSMSYRELGVNGAVEIPLGTMGDHRIRIRPGLGVYKLFAMQGLHMNDASVRMYTRPDGRAVDLRSDYDLNTALPEDGGHLLRGLGSGMAIDASVGLRIGDHIQAFIGIDDMGTIRYDEGVKNYRATGAYSFRGVQYTFIDQELESTVTLDSLIEMGDPDITQEAWSMNLPTRLLIGGTYGSKRIEYDRFPLFEHTWGFYVGHELTRPGFDNAATNVHASYTYTAAKVVSIGALGATNGAHAPRLGLNLTVRAGPVRFGIGSTNLSAFLFQGSGAGAQGQFALQVAW